MLHIAAIIIALAREGIKPVMVRNAAVHPTTTRTRILRAANVREKRAVILFSIIKRMPTCRPESASKCAAPEERKVSFVLFPMLSLLPVTKAVSIALCELSPILDFR